MKKLDSKMYFLNLWKQMEAAVKGFSIFALVIFGLPIVCYTKKAPASLAEA
ncbi:hypothetical protein N9Z53_01100 [Mariniblastus sp.]|nr:hypothetical protein [bacterium]MDB4372349.1 hypothetical protein [Mariniblastus sp.]